MIRVGSTYRLNRTLYFENAPPISKNTLCRVIGMAVFLDFTETQTTIEFEDGSTHISFFADEYLEPVE